VYWGLQPKAALSPQNNLLLVSNWACTSRPITTWYLSFFITDANVQRSLPLLLVKVNSLTNFSQEKRLIFIEITA
jgi:hypothetical protein